MALAPAPQQLVPTVIEVGGVRVTVEVADTDALRVQGLSGRTALPEGSGMLFVFERDDAWGIWMKDMRFAIDILWADKDGVVTTIIASISPDTYPQVFSPALPARYVLELPAGFAAKHGIAKGAQIKR